MGLDVYLYRYLNKKETDEKESNYNQYSEKLWEDAGDYESLSEEQKNEITEKCKNYALSMGLDKWGSDETNKICIEENSTIYPEHMFKIGYFRSSYNSGGINRILKNFNLPGLEEIMGYDDKYTFQPNWESALENVNSVITKLKETPGYRVESVSGNLFRESQIKSEASALEVFLQEVEKNKGGDYGYSNVNGNFYMNEPLKVLALIPGKQNLLGDRECTYVVTESDNTWYIQSLEIVKETIEYVINKENRDQYYLHWSG